jgi:hypothetical protein
MTNHQLMRHRTGRAVPHPAAGDRSEIYLAGARDRDGDRGRRRRGRLLRAGARDRRGDRRKWLAGRATFEQMQVHQLALTALLDATTPDRDVLENAFDDARTVQRQALAVEIAAAVGVLALMALPS